MGGICTQRKHRQNPYAATSGSFFALSISSDLPTFLLPLSSHLICSVHQGPNNEYNCSQTAGLQPVLGPPQLPAWLERQHEKDLCSWQKSMENKGGGLKLLENGQRGLSGHSSSSLVPPAVVPTYPPSLWLQIPISCSPALQHPPHFLLQPMSGWRRMSPACCPQSCSLFAPWVCGLSDGLRWFTPSHIHTSSRVEEFSTRCRGPGIIPFNNLE